MGLYTCDLTESKTINQLQGYHPGLTEQQDFQEDPETFGSQFCESSLCRLYVWVKIIQFVATCTQYSHTYDSCMFYPTSTDCQTPPIYIWITIWSSYYCMFPRVDSAFLFTYRTIEHSIFRWSRTLAFMKTTLLKFNFMLTSHRIIWTQCADAILRQALNLRSAEGRALYTV